MSTKPIEPKRPEDNDAAKFELVKAMGVAIAAIAKEKEVFITEAEITRNSNDYWELSIKAVVPGDKKTGDEYNKELRIYWTENEKWIKNGIMKKFGFTETQYKEAEKAWQEYASNTNYSSRISKEDWFESKYFIAVDTIIEVQ
jgi:hypothetical protein